MTSAGLSLLLPLVLVAAAVALTRAETEGLECQSEEIACSSENKCVKRSYVCDGERDCAGGEDEDSDLCVIFKSHYGCEREEVVCRRGGELTCMSLTDYCQQTDPPCEGGLDPKMCRVLLDNVIHRFASIVLPSDGVPDPSWRVSEALGEDLVGNMNNTFSHPRCPEMFTMVGEQCISLFTVGKVSWGESRAFCQVLGGDLLVIQSVDHFATILQHLQRHQMTSDFWLAGRQREKGRGWAWLDNSPMALGSPYWAVRRYKDCEVRNVTTAIHTTREANGATCYHYRQAPEPDQMGYCAALSYKHYYYITDEDCLAQKSPLCVAN